MGGGAAGDVGETGVNGEKIESTRSLGIYVKYMCMENQEASCWSICASQVAARCTSNWLPKQDEKSDGME